MKKIEHSNPDCDFDGRYHYKYVEGPCGCICHQPKPQPKADSKLFMIEPGHHVNRARYVEYLRDCARRWRLQPTNGTDASIASLEKQARMVEAKADRIEKGEDD